MAYDLNVNQRLGSWAASFSFLDEHAKGVTSAHRFLLHMDTEKRDIYIEGFSEREEELASNVYSVSEIFYADDPNQHVVLVTAGSYMLLKQGYPGFFADTTGFQKVVTRALMVANNPGITVPAAE